MRRETTPEEAQSLDACAAALLDACRPIAAGMLEGVEGQHPDPVILSIAMQSLCRVATAQGMGPEIPLDAYARSAAVAITQGGTSLELNQANAWIGTVWHYVSVMMGGLPQMHVEGRG